MTKASLRPSMFIDFAELAPVPGIERSINASASLLDTQSTHHSAIANRTARLSEHQLELPPESRSVQKRPALRPAALPGWRRL
jgi:hypothetical protein